MADEKELKDQRIPIMMTETEVVAIDDWAFKRRIRSRGEAIRRLCQIGLETSNAAPTMAKNSSELVATCKSAIRDLLGPHDQDSPEGKGKIVEFATAVSSEKTIYGAALKSVLDTQHFLDVIKPLIYEKSIDKALSGAIDAKFASVLVQIESIREKNEHGGNKT